VAGVQQAISNEPSEFAEFALSAPNSGSCPGLGQEDRGVLGLLLTNHNLQHCLETQDSSSQSPLRQRDYSSHHAFDGQTYIHEYAPSVSVLLAATVAPDDRP
jgi:hypothetical protein